MFTAKNFHGVNGDGIEAIAIAIPIRTYHAPARKALLAWKHGFVDKPLAACSSHVVELVEIVSQLSLTLTVRLMFMGGTPVSNFEAEFVRYPGVQAVKGGLLLVEASS